MELNLKSGQLHHHDGHLSAFTHPGPGARSLGCENRQALPMAKLGAAFDLVWMSTLTS